jgi:4-amino-4-deoxy-L-arabinose transferase-like glycosyltransferase
MNKGTRFFALALGITLLAFLLRVYRLDAQSFWWDEIFSISIAGLPFPDWLLYVLTERSNPPGYYFFLTLLLPFGTQEFFVRYLSVMSGTTSVALMARLGALLGGARVGVMAALLMAVSPFYVWYAQEARMYAPLVCLVLASSWAFLELVRRPRARVALALFVGAVFGLSLHYLFGLYLLTQLVFLLLSRGRYPRALHLWVWATFSAGALFVMWLAGMMLIPQPGRPNLDWIPNAQWYDPALTFYSALLGASAEPTIWGNWVTPLVGLGLAVFGGVMFWKPRTREKVRFLLTWLLLPWAFLFLLSIVMPRRSLYVDRYLAAFLLPLLLLMALGFGALYARHRAAAFGAAAVMFAPMLFSLTNMYAAPRYARDDWRGAVAFLSQNMQARDAVVLDLSLELPFDFYNTQKVPRVERPFADDPQMNVWFENNVAFKNHSAVWLVTTALPINVHRFYPDEAGQRAFAEQDAFKRAMDRRYKILQTQWFPGLVLTKYQVTP